MGDNMEMGRAASVVTGENGLKSRDSIRVGLLDSTEKGLVKVGGIVAVSVHAAVNARIDTGRVATPDVPIEILNWLTSLNVDELSVDVDWDTVFLVANIVADQLALDPEWTNLTLRSKDADWVLGKELARGCVDGDIKIGMVRRIDNLVSVTGLDGDGALLVLFEQGCTASLRTSIDSACFKFVGALVQGASSIMQKVPLGHGSVGGRLMDTGMGKSKPGCSNDS